ncbi:hypothetical protein I4F81_006834 [Pyropia yezoensis]|uniref:Uncharacterized protein n=1 Tax=Pyropia yezoensis TaxID=2788 RepID=A0ACC3C266_PYRYE|nr:hypothetical protein I4F81_006834 [Neopyropia yezoensis]
MAPATAGPVWPEQSPARAPAPDKASASPYRAAPPAPAATDVTHIFPSFSKRRAQDAREGVAAFNYSVNAYALRALGALRDGGVAPVVAAAATGGPIPNVRRAAAAALARLDVPDVGGVWATLRGVAAEAQGDWSVRYAAVAAMEEFGVRGVGAGKEGGGGKERDAALGVLRDLAGGGGTGGPVDAVAARAQLALLALEGAEA